MEPRELAVTVCRAFKIDTTTIEMLSVAGRHTVFMAILNGKWRAFKVTTDHTQHVQLNNEAQASRFLAPIFEVERRVADGKGAYIPSGDGVVTTGVGWSAISSECVVANWFATKVPHLHLVQKMEMSDLQDVLRVILTLHRIERRQVPGYFLDRAAGEFTAEHYRQRFDEYLAPVMRAGMLTARDGERLAQMAFDQPIVRHFVHHDIVPWNLGRDFGGRLVLIDAEFARWGMAYYDVAYFYLQSWIMLEDFALASRSMELFRAGFHAAGFHDFDELLWTPLAYRLAANLNVALEQRAQMPLAQRMVRRILARDHAALIQ